MPISIGDQTVDEVFIGDMGVKEIYIGDELIYTRQGGYFYLELDTSEQTT